MKFDKTLKVKDFTISPEIIALSGVLLGGVISFLTAYLIKSKEVKLKIVEKIIDKRIVAHEDILKISQRLRSTISLGKTDSEGNIVTYPSVLHSPETLDDFKGVFYDLINPNIHWINIELNRELNYLQDYIASISIQLENIPSEKYPEVALLVKQDLIDLATKIHDETTKFLNNDIFLVKAKPTKGHHKLPISETRSRYNNTLLFKNFDTIKAMKRN